MSPENALYQVLKTARDTAADGKVLKGSAVHPTEYASVRNDLKAVRVGNCQSDFAPYGESVKEFDGDITLQILVKVEDEEDAESYPAARELARTLAQEVFAVLQNNLSLSGASCDLLFRRAFRGWTKVDGCVFAVVLLPIRINHTGKYEL